MIENKPRLLIAFNGADSVEPLDYVHPYARKDIEKILERLPEHVEMIIVYGSSLRDFMRDDSDIDLATISPHQYWYLPKNLGYKWETERELDIKNFSSYDDLISQAEGGFPTPKAILEEGLLVFKKNRRVSLIEVREPD